jgi:glucose/arabinose dehydrogenase
MRARRVGRPTIAGLAVVGVLAVAVGGAWWARSPDRGDAGASDPTAGASTSTSLALAPLGPPGQDELDGIELGLEPVVEIEHPTAVAQQPGSGDLYASGVAGRIVRVPAAGGEPVTVANIGDRISTSGESGLLDIAFDATGDLLYMSLVETDGDLVLWEVASRDGRLAVDSPRVLLSVASPTDVHHAGDVDVDAAGLVWYSIGDGGPSQGLSDRAQDLGELRGKILRIDPQPGSGTPYQIPPGNPFAGRPDARAEIWAYGLRNPWRFDLDPVTGDLWIGDVGRNDAEEIDHLPGPDAGAGANLGWPHLEGTSPAVPGGPPDLVAPVLAYPHDGRCGVTAGSVYRGTAIPQLAGAFLYSDLCDGRIRALSLSAGEVTAERAFDAQAGYPVAFGTDLDGEMYLCSFDLNAIYRITAT